MKNDRFKALLVGLVLGVLAWPMPSWADDGAASIGAGGLVSKRESRITMAKEVLRIRWNSVVVDYDFRNDTDEDVTTEVAFPIPPYKLDWDEFSISQQGFDDFRLLVNGQPTKFQTQIKGCLKGVDVTSVLARDRIDIATFGHFDDDQHVTRDVQRLSKANQQTLVKAGLIDSLESDAEGTWAVEKKYYWSQTFPAHSTVHIRHTYTPVTGFQMTDSTTMAALPTLLRQKSPEYPLDVIQSMCPDQAMLNRIAAQAQDRNGWLRWVDFILTTANTWKQPIKDFTLIVDRPHEPKDGQVLVSFCSPGAVESTGPNQFTVHVKDFVPTKELRIGYIQLSAEPPKRKQAPR